MFPFSSGRIRLCQPFVLLLLLRCGADPDLRANSGADHMGEGFSDATGEGENLMESAIPGRTILIMHSGCNPSTVPYSCMMRAEI